jgi:hypothetical protein
MEKRGIFGIFLVLTILVFAGISLADNETEEENVADLDFDEGQGYDWLISQLEATNWGSDVETISWAVLALYSSDYDEYQDGVDKLKSLENVNNNWGDVFHTSMAVLALDAVGEDVEGEVQWLLNQQQANLAGGQWLIQFNPDSSNTQATCAVGYGGIETHFSMQGYNLTAPGGCLVDESWVDFEVCIKHDEADIYEPMSVICVGRVSSSLLFYSGGAFYIIDGGDAGDELEIKNGCFYGPAGGCDCYHSQFSSWALDEADDGSYSIPYLRASCNDDILDNAFLYMLTGGNSYRDWLLSDEGQSGDGSFGPGNIELTALTVIGLRKGGSGSVADSVNWLEFVQDGFTGSWNQDERLTGMVLYALNVGGGTYIPYQGGDYCSVADGDECETNNDCNSSLVCSNSCQCIEESVSCISNLDCQVGEICNLITGECETEQVSRCNNNLDCAPGYYCDTSIGQCVAEDIIPPDDEYVPPQQDGDSSWVTWLVAILVVILALGLGWFAYIKFVKGKGKGGGENSPVFVPRRPSTPGYPTTRSNVPASGPARGIGRGEAKLEKDLDKALKKAKELVGK